MNVQVEVSLGELVDKISILRLKIARIADQSKVAQAKKEEAVLSQVLTKLNLPDIDKHLQKLEEINGKLWEIEDDIRLKEKDKKFDQEFISLARAVYVTNDERFAAKNEVNRQYGSNIVEVKSYEDYS